MKHLILISIALLCIAVNGKAQHFNFLNKVELTDQESYKEYIDQVFDCCYYVLQTPFDKKDVDRNTASGFVVKWVNGCTDCQFALPDHIKTLTEEKEALITLYTVCHVKEYLENADDNISLTELTNKAEVAFITYCSDGKNKMKITKEMKQVFEMKSSGEIKSLEEYFASK